MAERGRPRGFDRTEALERAMDLFWRETYEGASLADLTGAMGIAAPSLYAAFGSKEQLFREVVEHYANTQDCGIWQTLDEVDDIRSAVEGFLLATADAYSTGETPPGCLIVLGAQHGLDDGSPARRELRERRRDNLRRLAARFDRAIAEGALPGDFPAHDAAAFYLSVQTGMSLLARDGADRACLRAVAQGAMLGWDRWIEGAPGG